MSPRQSKSKSALSCLVIGDINIDVIIPAEEYPPVGGEVVVEHADFRLGGSGCNTAVSLAKLGAETAIIGNLGTDPFGQIAQQYIESANVKTLFIQQKEGFQTGCFTILTTPDGQRTMFGSRGSNAEPPQLTKILPHLQDIDLLHISGYTFIDDQQWKIVQQLIEKASEERIIISLDSGMFTVNTAKHRLETILPMIDLLLISSDELTVLTSLKQKDKSVMHILKRGTKSVVLKKGSCGSEYFDLCTHAHQPALKSSSITNKDTTGAGDCFNAGFLYGYLKGLENQESLLLGNTVAFISIISEHGISDLCKAKNLKEDICHLLSSIEFDKVSKSKIIEALL